MIPKKILINKLISQNYLNYYKTHGLIKCIEMGFSLESTGEAHPAYGSYKNLFFPACPMPIIIYTGAFCPFHSGHEYALQYARNYIDKREDIKTLGIHAIVVPDHDLYVGPKTDNYLNCYERCAWASKCIEKNPSLRDWVTVDIITSYLLNSSINYTEVLNIFLFLKDVYLQNSNIYYLCGEDNKRFQNFMPGDVRFIEVPRSNNSTSSTQIRKYYDSSRFKINKNKKEIIVRAYRNQENLIPYDILKEHFTKVSVVYIEDQLEYFKNNIDPKTTISLDFHTPVNHFVISRLYNKFGHIKRKYYIPSGDNYVLLNTLDKNITYDLFDDDICTGNTIKEATSFLRTAGFKISDNPKSYIKTDVETTEVLDLKDILPQNIYTDDRQYLRVQEYERYKISSQRYILPYVDPYVRLSVLDPVKFSTQIKEFYDNYETNTKPSF